jgi:hypothetical protein
MAAAHFAIDFYLWQEMLYNQSQGRVTNTLWAEISKE